jgi:hypothetical protein
VLPTSPVLITGTIPEEPVVTRVVTAGSGVWCGSVLPDADACGVAFRVAMDAHFASHSDWLPCVAAAHSGRPDVVPVAVTAGDKIEGLRQWAAGRCLSADRAGVYSRSESVSGSRVRRVVREPGLIEWVVLRAPKDTGPGTLRCPARL